MPVHNLDALAQRVKSPFTWEDIVLPEDSREQLMEVATHFRYRQKVYGEWGFEAKMDRGKGICVLFSGPSGTGKTMAAEILANDLGLELYRIDLSAVVSKYIGETEKNLRKVFEEGEKSQTILFFDEADALFGKRSEVRDSHDRYANIEINYLLQRMESYAGASILATNMRAAIDPAFLRRLRTIIEFPMPDVAQREAIWRKSFPAAATPNGVDFRLLAKQFPLSGGNIKNAALNAAFFAAADSDAITMDHVAKAVRREYAKMGKLCTVSGTGKYL
jgi:SpoVK/Ycf46/Vps4 family AAA+-type ATPase